LAHAGALGRAISHALRWGAEDALEVFRSAFGTAHLRLIIGFDQQKFETCAALQTPELVNRHASILLRLLSKNRQLVSVRKW